jgi:Spy/CpxP family protein refolding chaperone
METTKTGREAALLVVVVFLLGVLLGGVGMHLWGGRVWGGQAAANHDSAHPGGMAPREEVLARFTRELQLTPDQQQQVGAIIDDTRAQWKALYAQEDAQKDQIRQQGRARIRALLTPEQQPKFDSFMQRLDEQRKKEQAAH